MERRVTEQIRYLLWATILSLLQNKISVLLNTSFWGRPIKRGVGEGQMSKFLVSELDDPCHCHLDHPGNREIRVFFLQKPLTPEAFFYVFPPLTMH